MCQRGNAHEATLKSKSIKFVNLLKETAKIETGMAEKSSKDQANRRQKHGSVWRKRKKISQIIKDDFYLPFFLLINLWPQPNRHISGTFLYKSANMKKQ
jgi:hypothetical protein